MARVNDDPKYKSYRNGRDLKQPAEDLLKASGVDLTNGGGFEELRQFQEHFSDYKILVFDALNPYRVMFSGNYLTPKKLYLLYDRKFGHYNVITKLKGATAQKYVCNGCDNLYDNNHKCGKFCSLCTATPPCTKNQTKHCDT